MNKIFIFTFVMFSVLFSFQASAQGTRSGRPFNRESFEARQNAYITAQVGLTPEEAASFIPLCNELRKKKYEVGRDERRFAREIRSKKNPTDADYTKVVNDNVNIKVQQAQLDKEYYEKFRKILSPEKLYKYQEAESQFARSFMRSSMGREGDTNRQKK